MEKVCVECGKPTKEKYRRLCWACTNCHWRHGMTVGEWEKVKAEKVTTRNPKIKVCRLCGKNTHFWMRVGNSLVCDKCGYVIGVMFRSKNWLVKAQGILWALEHAKVTYPDTANDTAPNIENPQ